MPLPEPAASSEMRKEETSSNEENKENNANLINVVSGCCNFCLKKVLVPFGLMKWCIFQISAGDVTCEKEKKVGFACAESNGRYCALLLLFPLSFFSTLKWLKKNKNNECL